MVDPVHDDMFRPIEGNSHEEESVPFGKYELLRRIGRGGMAEIYKARMTGPGGFEKIVVIKKILPSLDANRAFIEMFVEEANLSASLQHTNIVQIFELGDVDGQHYIAMEYVYGRDLLQVLNRCRAMDRHLPPELGVFMVAELCKGLHHAHTAQDARGKPLNIIHRDVSPSNVLISFDGEVKIMDFGVARASRERARQTQTGVLKGKMGYMSPEQVVGDPFDHRADIFSLGILLFEALTLKRLFLADTDLKTLIRIRDVHVEERFRANAPWLAPGIRPILRRALSRDLEDRHPTARSLHDALLEQLFDDGKRADSGRLSAFMRELFSGEVKLPPEIPRDAVAAPAGPAMSPEAHPSRITEPPIVEAEPTRGRVAMLELEPLEEGLPTVAGRVGAAQVLASAARLEPFPGESNASVDEDPSKEGAGLDAAELEDAEFALRDTEGHVFGPIRWANFLRMLKYRSIGEDEHVSINGADWRSVRDLTRLKEIAPDDFPRGATDVTRRGAIDVVSFLRVVFDLYTERKTGILRLWRERTAKEVFFKRGRPRHITSNIKDELFGAFLVERGVLTEKQLDAGLEQARSMEGRLGDALIVLEYLHPAEVTRLLSRQLQEKFIELFSWESGCFAFHEDAHPPSEVAPLELDPLQSITEGVRTWVGLDALDPHFFTRMDAAIQVRSEARIATRDLGFSARESRFLTYLQGAASLRAVVDRQGRKPEDRLTLLRLAFLLEEMDVIRVGDGPVRGGSSAL